MNLVDFKQPLELNLAKVNKSSEGGTKDFKDTLKSVTKDIETKKETSTTGNNKEVEDLEDEIVEEDKKPSLENMVNLLSLINIDDNSKSEETMEDTITLDIDIPDNENPIILEEDAVVAETIIEEDIDFTELYSKLENLENKEEIDSEVSTKVINKDHKSEVKVEAKVAEEEISLNMEEVEDEISVNENIVINSEEEIDNGENELNHSNKNNETKSVLRYELVDSDTKEKDMEVKNENLAPFIKDGIEFSTDKPVEVEIPVVEEKEVIEQIVDKVKFDLSETKNEIKLSLKPEALGEMTMNIEVAKGEVVAKIMVDNYRTKEIVEGNIIQLKEGIEDTGMEIKTFEVFVGNGSDFDQHSSNQFNFKENNKKLKIKTDNKKLINDYEDSTVEEKSNNNIYHMEGGLNLLA